MLGKRTTGSAAGAPVTPASVAMTTAIFFIPDDGLTTIVHMDVFDPDKLMTAITQPSKNLNLHRIRFEQTSLTSLIILQPDRCSRRSSANQH